MCIEWFNRLTNNLRKDPFLLSITIVFLLVTIYTLSLWHEISKKPLTTDIVLVWASIMNLLLVFFVIAIMHRQAETGREQKTIADKQSKLIELEKKPMIAIEVPISKGQSLPTQGIYRYAIINYSKYPIRILDVLIDGNSVIGGLKQKTIYPDREVWTPSQQNEPNKIEVKVANLYDKGIDEEYEYDTNTGDLKIKGSHENSQEDDRDTKKELTTKRAFLFSIGVALFTLGFGFLAKFLVELAILLAALVLIGFGIIVMSYATFGRNL